jgi:hypothetical protein
VLCLERGTDRMGGPTFEPSSKAVLLAGGNTERPCSGKQSVCYEGTASRVELWGPTFGIFARNSFIAPPRTRVKACYGGGSLTRRTAARNSPSSHSVIFVRLSVRK